MLVLFSVWKGSSVFSPAYLNNSSLILNNLAKREVWKLRCLNADCQTNLSHDRMYFQMGCWYSWPISTWKRRNTKKDLSSSLHHSGFVYLNLLKLPYNFISIIIHHPSISLSIYPFSGLYSIQMYWMAGTCHSYLQVRGGLHSLLAISSSRANNQRLTTI